MAEPSVTHIEHPEMTKQSLVMIAITSLVGSIGLIGMLNWPITTSAVLIFLLVVILRKGGAS
ncbi:MULTISPECIES: hypothetical protein [Thalassospira]|uniref:Uncharacterized protein n=1 Tax=Thalassospira profundimaris TaxID=502049 RepID=A0A367V3J5_9PROT|nr:MULTISPECIES: hypothetical protein [Thalassospira]KZB73471.1 hypothetical protein AUQ43_17275 [Thalassospira sp. MCCC 1A01148]RCK18952.1 hypothetical protein TH6_20375 [Thalassospira profundimaris]